MKLTSTAFVNGSSIPQKYTCLGAGINPPMEIQDVSQEAKSLALLVDDPDAPVGLFTHWVMWNIDPSTTEISENELPNEAMEGLNSSGGVGWTAPCPPRGTGVHHYNFILFALSEKLDLPGKSKREEFLEALKKLVIDKAELTGVYGE